MHSTRGVVSLYMVLAICFSILPANKQQTMRGAKCSRLPSSSKGKYEDMEKKHHRMVIQIQIQRQSPFSDVCWLHMTLTNKCFQHGCWPMEDMVRIW